MDATVQAEEADMWLCVRERRCSWVPGSGFGPPRNDRKQKGRRDPSRRPPEAELREVLCRALVEVVLGRGGGVEDAFGDEAGILAN